MYGSEPIEPDISAPFIVKLNRILQPSVDLAPEEINSTTADHSPGEHQIVNALGDNELTILRLVSIGLRNRDIGERVGMTEGSVKWYLHQIYEKMGVSKRADAVALARRLGLILQS